MTSRRPDDPASLGRMAQHFEALPPPRKPWQPIIVGVLLGMIIAIPVVHVAHKALPAMTEVRP